MRSLSTRKMSPKGKKPYKIITRELHKKPLTLFQSGGGGGGGGGGGVVIKPTLKKIQNNKDLLV